MGLQQIVLKMSDGDCPVAVVTPEGTGPWPAVVLFMDAGGIRPGIIAMATRLAGAGYMALVPDLFYRFGPYAPLVPAEVFKGDFRATIGPMMATTNNHKAAADTGPLLDWLGLHPDTRDQRIGVVGYCMGGGMALTAAARFPDNVAAVASFHGGKLADDSEYSPHLLARDIRAEVYVASADSDDSYPLDMAERLQKRFRTPMCATNARFMPAPCMAGRCRISRFTAMKRRNAPGPNCWRCSRVRLAAATRAIRRRRAAPSSPSASR